MPLLRLALLLVLGVLLRVPVGVSGPAQAKNVASGSQPAAAPGGSGTTIFRMDPGDLAYATYRNVRFGLAVDYPKDLFTTSSEIADGSGRTFLAPDHSAVFLASGERNDAGWTIGDLMSLSKQYHAARHATITYTRVGHGWCVVSGTDGGRIFYEKRVLGRGGRVMNTLLIEYPLELKSFFDPVVTRMSWSFR